MGFFSWNCKHCGKEVLAPYPYTKWSQAVAISPDNEVVMGVYDGYGRIEDDLHDDVEIYHAHCWEEIGSPMEYSGPSDYANGQGYFIDSETLQKDYPIDGGWKFFEDCKICNGYGYIIKEDDDDVICKSCDGVGWFETVVGED